MAINKETIHELVEIFYQPPFKTFYVNSSDGENFVKPLGVFVSLGITTSLKVLQDIKEVLSKSSGYKSVLGEIKSKKVAGQFLNYLSGKPEEEIVQYDMTDYPPHCFGEKESKDLLESLSKDISIGLDSGKMKIVCPQVNKLGEIIKKLDFNPQGWENHLIQETETKDYRIFHKKVNYKKSDQDESEYRIGIYVTEI